MDRQTEQIHYLMCQLVTLLYTAKTERKGKCECQVIQTNRNTIQ